MALSNVPPPVASGIGRDPRIDCRLRSLAFLEPFFVFRLLFCGAQACSGVARAARACAAIIAIAGLLAADVIPSRNRAWPMFV